LSQINRDNVSELELAWSFNMYTRRGVEATPLMVDGTLYATGSWSKAIGMVAIRIDKDQTFSIEGRALLQTPSRGRGGIVRRCG
jgi:hypothetical protein